MSKSHVEKINCKHCGKEFDFTIWDSINATLDPDLRENLIVRGDLYEYKCPHCGNVVTHTYPILYHDMEHKFMIHSGPLSEVMQQYKVNQKQIKKMNEMFGNLSKDYIYLGVTSPNELVEKIIIMENGYDYRIAVIYKMIFVDFYNQKNNGNMKTAIFTYDQDSEICIAGFDEKDEFIGLFHISEKIYKGIYEKYINKVNDVFSYVFDESIAAKLINTDDDEIESKKQFYTNYAVVQLENGRDIVASILPNQIKSFERGERVLVMTPGGFTMKGVVSMTLKMNNYEAPVPLDKWFVVITKNEPIEMITSKDSGEELDNEKLREKLLKYKGEEGKFPNDLIWESHAILGTKTTFSFLLERQLENGEVELGELLKEGGEFISPDQVTTKLEIREYNDRRYLCVYLSQKDVDEEVSGLTYRFNDLLELALVRTDCDGILVNPNSDEIIIPTPRILKAYIHERYMSNVSRMKKLLKSFDKEDIEYILEDNYKIICKVYFEGKNPEQIAEELNMSRKEVGDSLDYGYQYMMELLRSKYLFRKR